MENKIIAMAFFALGGFVIFLPAVILGKLTARGILYLIGGMLIVVMAGASVYLALTDSTLLEILTLNENLHVLPNRIFSVPYVVIASLVCVLPVAIIRIVVKMSKNGDKDTQAQVVRSDAENLSGASR